MKPPVFPKEFMQKHCLKVMEARDWRKIYDVVHRTEEDDLMFAECAFHSAGVGLQCESCSLFLAAPARKQAEEWIPELKEFNRQMELYEKWLANEAEEKKKIQQDLGSGI